MSFRAAKPALSEANGTARNPEPTAAAPPPLLDFFASNSGKLDVQTDEIIVSGDIAFTRGTLTITITPRHGGEAQTIRRRFVELWRKEPDRWRVARTMDAEI